MKKPRIKIQREDGDDEKSSFPGIKVRIDTNKELEELQSTKEELFPGVKRR